MSFHPMSVEAEKRPANHEARWPEDMALLRDAHLRYSVTWQSNVDE